MIHNLSHFNFLGRDDFSASTNRFLTNQSFITEFNTRNIKFENVEKMKRWYEQACESD